MRRSSFWPLIAVILLAAMRPAAAQVAGGPVSGGPMTGGPLSGEVETIGFENYYRPTAWTPMIVKLSSTADQAIDYQLRVYQEDLDRDRPIFTRSISVTGATSEGAARDQRFRMYFKPTPTDGGLPDATDPGATVATLQKHLSVQLWTSAGTPKFVAELPITGTIFNVDHNPQRGSKFVLAVSGGRSLPAHREYDGSTIGLLEDVAMVTIKTDQLPENPIGYDGVDAILWLDADPADLSSGGDEKFRALQQYVRNGGHLVICQPTESWQKSLGFGDLLPVTITGVQTKPDAEPLKSLATPQRTYREEDQAASSWDSLAGPMTLAVAQVKADGIVDTWIDWPNRPPSAYLARSTYGCGCVSWVAQDLGDPQITRVAESNWPIVWNRIFDWKDNPMNVTRVGKPALDEYADPQLLNAASGLDSQMDLPGKGFGLIAVALAAFVIYWLVAGPGTYFYLLSKHRTEASWFLFAASAIVFAGLSAILVRLVLHGPAVLKHFSVARESQADAIHVYSRLGLYIPQDGDQTMALPNAQPGTTSSLTAFAISPQLARHDEANDVGQPYDVPIPDLTGDAVTTLRIPFRSTLKKFDANWTGAAGSLSLGGGIEGRARLTETVSVDGRLTNATGQTLHDVYFAFKWKAPPQWKDSLNASDVRDGDYLVYLPNWDAGSTIDLNPMLTLSDTADSKYIPTVDPNRAGPKPGQNRKVRGRLQTDWTSFWFDQRSNSLGEAPLDLNDALVVLSLFNRIAPDHKTVEHPAQFDLLRAGAHRYDASSALAAGSMVIIAHVDSPDLMGPPLPLEVNGRNLRGEGTTLCQFIVPVDNGDNGGPMTTKPSTAP